MTKPSVAFLGLGTMGAGMAANLLKSGFPLTVYNRTPERAEALASAGARVAATPADAAKDAAVIVSMLADDAASRTAWTGERGALAGAKAGAVLVESSTLSPGWIQELRAQAESRGQELIDAPVTGSRLQAEAGQLIFLVGGSESALAKAAPLLEVMGKQIVHLGPVGSGATMKLVNNFLCGVQIASLAEALGWLERSGLDPEKALSILKNGAPGSPMVSNISTRMMSRDYTVNFLLKLMLKDLRYAQAAAAESGVTLKTAQAARERFESAAAEGHAEQDMAAIIEPLRAKT